MSHGHPPITGTLLQNNLKELFVLLNFICPEIFFLWHVMSNVEKIFCPACACADAALPAEKEFNIYVDLMEIQWKWYCSMLEKDMDAVNVLVLTRVLKVPVILN
ncbi:hypothetical protein EDB19DRAFT_1828670 [Suillus lakei]|nr:hypothetical protein EDB19DRAFT_1828670 [Suillus lakei]